MTQAAPPERTAAQRRRQGRARVVRVPHGPVDGGGGVEPPVHQRGRPPRRGDAVRRAARGRDDRGARRAARAHQPRGVRALERRRAHDPVRAAARARARRTSARARARRRRRAPRRRRGRRPRDRARRRGARRAHPRRRARRARDARGVGERAHALVLAGGIASPRELARWLEEAMRSRAPRRAAGGDDLRVSVAYDARARPRARVATSATPGRALALADGALVRMCGVSSMPVRVVDGRAEWPCGPTGSGTTRSSRAASTDRVTVPCARAAAAHGDRARDGAQPPLLSDHQAGRPAAPDRLFRPGEGACSRAPCPRGATRPRSCATTSPRR